MHHATYWQLMVEDEIIEYLLSNFCGHVTLPEVYKAIRNKVLFNTLRAAVLRSAELVDCTSRPHKYRLGQRLSAVMSQSIAASG